MSHFIFIIEAVIGFGILVFVHELGHFLAAKWIGVKVLAFSLGFGPSIRKKWGETEYRLSAIPLGGYVKMAGEEPEEGKTPQPGDFYSKSVGKRIIVFVAGVTMNLIFGFLAFVIAFKVGVPTIPAVVGDVEQGSSAWKVGLQPGDEIVDMDALLVWPPVDFEDVKTTITLAGRGSSIGMDIQRGSEKFKVSVQPKYHKDIGLQTTGIVMPMTMIVEDVPVEAPDDDDPDFRRIYNAGIKPGDRIVAVQLPGGEPEPVANPLEFMPLTQRSAGKPVTIIYERDGVKGSALVKPQRVGKPYKIGVVFGSNKLSAVRGWAETAGLAEGDSITSIAGARTETSDQVKDALAVAQPGDEIKYLRDGMTHVVKLPANVTSPEEDIAFVGGTTVNNAWQGYPAARAGIKTGDVITQVGGKAVSDVPSLAEQLLAAKGNPVTISWTRNGKMMSAEVVPEKEWIIDVPFKSAQEILVLGAGQSITRGARKAIQWIFRIYGTLKSLIFGEVSARHLSGPITIARMTYYAAETGVGTLLYILAILNVNLAVVNLLPIPVLDGGHVLFGIIEKIRGQPVSDRVRGIATYIGLSLLLCLLAVAFFNDIKMLFVG